MYDKQIDSLFPLPLNGIWTSDLTKLMLVDV